MNEPLKSHDLWAVAHHKRPFSRRQFLQLASTTTAVAVTGAKAGGQTLRSSPNQRLAVGVVGLGSRGFNLLNEMLVQADVQVVAICDVDRLHYRDRAWGSGAAMGREPAERRVAAYYQKSSPGKGNRGPAVYSDYRRLCSRDDLDIVVVATPDHWHALIALEALREGKDVYCEKPLTHTFYEGQLVCREVAQRKAVFQVGSQQRSAANFQQAVRLVQGGYLGKVQQVEVGLSPGYDRPMGDAQIQDPPEQLDYNLWTGPAPLMAYMRARHHRWWRGHRAYGGGVLMDWIGHHNDIAHWGLGMDQSGPHKVEAVGWTYPQTDVYDSPQDYEIRCEFAGGVTSIISSRNRSGTKFIGEHGWLHVDRGVLEASDPKRLSMSRPEGSKAGDVSHVRNFLDCVKSRHSCIAPAETGHRSITPGHLGYVSNAVGRPLQWDAKAERVTNDDEADQLLKSVSYRQPWSLA